MTDLEKLAREWLEGQIPGEVWTFNRTLLLGPLVHILRSRDERARQIVGEVADVARMARSEIVTPCDACDEIRRRLAKDSGHSPE